MQHSARALHDDEYADTEEEPQVECYDKDEHSADAGGVQSFVKGHGPQNKGKLLMRKRKGPETEVGCGVGDAVKAEF